MKLKNRFIFNLQHFAEENNNDEQNNQQGEGKTFTQEELDAIIQKRLLKAQDKWTKEYEKKLADEKAEAQRLAEMDATQRAQAQAEKKLKELEAREAEIQRKELKIQCEEILQSRNLPQSLSTFLLASNADQINENINIFEKAFKDAVSAEVDARIKGKTPDGTHQDDNAVDKVSKEEFKKLRMDEQQALYHSNPEVYKSYYGA